MTEEDLLENYPTAFHMAEGGSWPSIRAHGLLSTSALLDLYGLEGEERHELESQRRSESVKISRPGLPDAIIRDNKPMTASALQKCLTGGIEPTQWFETLNLRAFFWLSKERLDRLLAARAYRDRPQTVLKLNTASLVNAHRANVRLSPINSGATIYNPVARGNDTFQTIEDYPFDDWRAKRKGKPVDAIVELTILGGVPDIMKHVMEVDHFESGKATPLWRP